MKKKLYSLSIIIIIIITLINIFDHSSIINQIIAFSFKLFINNIFPSLFPMFVISKILVDIGLPELLGSISSNFMYKLFKVKGMGSFIFFMSMITGFPSSAKYIKDLIDKDLIDNNDANKILMFTFFSNPLFIINTVGIMFFNNVKIGIYILISHILGNIIIGLLFRNYNVVSYNKSTNFKDSLKIFHRKINNTNIFNSFLNGIKDSLNTLISIFGIITSFLIITSLINYNINITPIKSSIFTGVMEMTSGLKSISLTNASLVIKVIISTFFISFGGLSVHSQIMNILSEYNIKYSKFLLARILHGFISVIIILFFSMGGLF